MLRLIDRSNRDIPENTALLETFYRVRHDLYLSGFGRRELARLDKREVDQFDTADATYFVWERDGEVLGGARFVPSHLPHLMSDIFSHIATLAPVPRRATVWEITRLFSVPDSSKRVKRNTVIGDLLCGMFELGLHKGLEAISVVCDTFFLPRFLEQNLKAIPLGLPTPYPEGICVACTLPVNEHQLRAARDARGVHQAVLFDVPVRSDVYV